MVDEQNWEANRRSLAVHAPALWRRIQAAGTASDLRWDGAHLQWWRGLTPVVVRDGDGPDPAGLPQANEIVCMGFGTGEWVLRLLERTDRIVRVWDRNPTFLRPALITRDWSRWLQCGRLTLHAGADLLDLEGPRVMHPILGAAYPDERAWRVGPKRALLVHGTLFVDDVGEALRAEGWQVFRWEVSGLPVAELDATARAVDPQVVVGINHTNGLAEACAELGVPLVEWEIDPSTDDVRRTTAGGATVWTWRRENVPIYRRNGFEAHYLPLASNPEVRRPLPLTPQDQARYAVPLAYVGSSMVERGHRLLAEFVTWFQRIFGAGDGGRELADTLLALQAQAGDRYVIPELLAQVAPGLVERFSEAGCPHRPDAMLAEAAAATFRLRTLAGLGDLGLHVWGDPGWERLTHAGVHYRGWAGHFDELTRIYNGAAVHIDVGRLYQLDIVPMRIFDVIAAGGFVLAQHSDALADLLTPGVEVATWRTADELREKAAFYLHHPDARGTIVRAGRGRVLAEHTVRHRVRTILATRAA